MRNVFAIAFFLMFCSFVGLSQSITPKQALANKQDSAQTHSIKRYRIYVGLAASKGNYKLPTNYALTTIAPVLTVGLQFKKRLALQLSAGYYQQQYNSSVGLPVAGPPASYLYIIEKTSYRGVVVPLALSYTLTRQLEHRLKANIVGGAILTHVSSNQIVTIDNTQSIISNFLDKTTTGFYLSLGPALSYRLAPDLDLTSDLIFNRLMNQQNTSNTRSGANLTMGVRYHFRKR